MNVITCPSGRSGITGVRPLWAVEGGAVTILGDGFSRRAAARRPDRRRARPPRVGVAAARSTCSCRRGLDGGRTADPHRHSSRRNRIRRGRRPARHRPAPGRQSGLRPGRQPLRDVQRLSRPGVAGLDFHRPPRRFARAVRQRHSRIRRRSRSTPRGASTSRAASTAPSIE